jgi:hypothetical protein
MWKKIIVLAAALVPLTAQADAKQCNEALARAHAHNDYEHERPLFDALDQGFASVEADIWLIDGELRVAHDLEAVEPGRTLEALYLEPLRDLVRAQHGFVHPCFKHSLQLLIDIKSEGEPTYRALHKVLARYADILTVFTDWGVREGAVTAVISGNRPREVLQGQWLRFAGYDGRSADLGVETDAGFAPLISDNWTNLFTWVGVGAFSDQERSKLHDYVAEAHEHGQRVRFWATPEDPATREAVWAALIDAGVDYINTDDLAGLHAYLLANDPAPHAPELDWFGRYYGFDPH